MFVKKNYLSSLNQKTKIEEGVSFFFFSNQLFEVDLNLFNQHSIQFLNEGNTEEEPFFLVSEFEQELQHQEETIEAFINFFIQTKSILLQHMFFL